MRVRNGNNRRFNEPHDGTSWGGAVEAERRYQARKTAQLERDIFKETTRDLRIEASRSALEGSEIEERAQPPIDDDPDEVW